MRYSTQSRERKCIQEHDFMSSARKCCDKYSKKVLDTAAMARIDAAKTASKRVVRKTAEASGDLIGNKISDKITKSNIEPETLKEIYKPPKKC